MRIGVLVGVKDEAALIGPLIEHLFAIGADGVLVGDQGSTDGTVERVRALAEGPHAGRLILATAAEIAPHMATVTDLHGPVIGRLRALCDPDWLFVCDADEFFVPRGGSLKAAVAGETRPILRHDRYNAALSVPGEPGPQMLSLPGLADVPVWAERRVLSAEVLAVEPQTRWVQHRIGAKLHVHASVRGRMIHGLHTVEPEDGAPLPHAASRDLLCVHLPFSTYARFARKVGNTRAVFAAGPALAALPKGGWHWAHWIAQADAGRLEAEFLHQFVGPEELAALRARGAVRTPAEILADLT